MKKIMLVFLFCFGSKGFAQFVSSFGAYEAHGNKVAELDSRYKSALHTNSELAVFKTEQEQKAFTEAYQGMLSEFGAFLTKSGFAWEKQTRCFNRIYFNESGKVDYFLFHFKDLDAKKAATFQQLLSDFVKTYTFPLKPKVKFAQCSPVVYQ
jgi:hypothetical protein